MKRIILVSLSLGLLLGMTSLAFAGEAAQLTGHRLESLDGKATTLSDFRGEVLLVNFWAAWCKPCVKELPVMDEWHRAWEGKGARVIAISVDTDDRKVRRFVDKKNLALDVFVDGPDGLAKSLDLPALPTTYILDSQGKLVGTITDTGDDALAKMHRQVQSLLSTAKAPAVRAGVSGD